MFRTTEWCSWLLALLLVIQIVLWELGLADFTGSVQYIVGTWLLLVSGKLNLYLHILTKICLYLYNETDISEIIWCSKTVRVMLLNRPEIIIIIFPLMSHCSIWISTVKDAFLRTPRTRGYACHHCIQYWENLQGASMVRNTYYRNKYWKSFCTKVQVVFPRCKIIKYYYILIISQLIIHTNTAYFQFISFKKNILKLL